MNDYCKCILSIVICLSLCILGLLIYECVIYKTLYGGDHIMCYDNDIKGPDINKISVVNIDDVKLNDDNKHYILTHSSSNPNNIYNINAFRYEDKIIFKVLREIFGHDINNVQKYFKKRAMLFFQICITANYAHMHATYIF